MQKCVFIVCNDSAYEPAESSIAIFLNRREALQVYKAKIRQCVDEGWNLIQNIDDENDKSSEFLDDTLGTTWYFRKVELDKMH